MRFYLGTTDFEWYEYLSGISPQDINFWRPGGETAFRALSPGEPFLFKLKHPYNAIGGVGFFSAQTKLLTSMAWDIFRDRNGCPSFSDFQKKILHYRTDKQSLNPEIGCIVLTNPIFFKMEDWIEIPEDWSKSIVQGKTYETNSEIGDKVWQEVRILIDKYLILDRAEDRGHQLLVENQGDARYGNEVLRKVRLGQGAFRILVMDAYQRRCAITGERTMPVLDAAHIQPYGDLGPHQISNGLLLRSDMHKLFDTGYITLTKDHVVEVSKKISEEFENGKEYYHYHGKQLFLLPKRVIDQPAQPYIDWHNNIFKG